MVTRKERLTEAARQFLRSGRVSAVDPSALAEECNRIVRAETQRSMARAISLAKNFVRYSRQRRDMPLQLALRALAWAFHAGGKYKQAEKTYLEARQHVKRDWLVRARIDRILIDVYMYLGDLGEARRRARLALGAFRRHGAEEDLSKTRINYANLFHRQDRHREANRQYRLASEYFEVHGGELVLGLCYYNQANTLVQLFDFEKAESLYRRAQRKFAALGFQLYVNECQYGLAWLRLLQGDYHSALEGLAKCEESYRAASQPKGVMLCQLDRAEAFLGLNLFSDARKAAQTAWRQARRLGVHYESAKAAFFLARSSMALGREKEARAAIKRAEGGFRKENNHAFLAAVQLLAAQIDAGRGVSPAVLSGIRRRFARAQLPLWEAICDLELLSLWPEDKAVAHRLARNPAVRAVPHLYSHWQTHLGDLEADRGRMESAAHHWNQAAETLDAVRAKLPPVEMRSAFMHERANPYVKLISKDIVTNPAHAAVWSERRKTAGMWAAVGGKFADDVVRNKAACVLAELADRVTALSGRIGSSSGRRSAVGAQTAAALERLQREVRDNLAAVERLHEAKADRFDVLLEGLHFISRRQPAIQFHYDNGDLIAFIHHNGETRSHRYTDGRKRVNEFMGCWNVLLSRSLLSAGKTIMSHIREEQRLFSEMGSWLWAPTEIDSECRRVLILPEGKISNMPWMAIIHGGQPLVFRYCITLSPSIRHHLHAMNQRIRSDKIRVYVGRADGLSDMPRERSIFESAAGRDIVVYDPCRRGDWPDSGAAWIWHYAGHAHFRSDNPFYSSLSLADGPLFAADFRLKNHRVGLVTLAACRTGKQSMLPGEESTGLVRSLLEMGARNVVGSHWSVSDKSTAVWMRKFYDLILAGQPVSESVREAAIHVRQRLPSAYDWAAFSVFGAG